jgi:hypothetical protein
MPDLNRFFKNVWAAIAQEFNSVPDREFSRVLSVPSYRNDLEAVVTMTIRPGKTGQVQFQGSWWNARCNLDITLAPGQIVYIIDRQDNTLYVEPGFLLRSMVPMPSTVSQPG